MLSLSTVKIAWRNLWRNRRRSALAVLAIAVGQFALLAMDALMHGYADNIRSAITGPFIGHVQVHVPEWREERAMDLALDPVDDMLQYIRQDPFVAEASARIYAPVLVAPERNAFTAVVVGVDPEQENSEHGLLSGLSEPLAPGSVLVGYILARKTGARVGQEIAVVGQGADGSIANDLYRVQDIIKCPADLVNQLGVVMGLSDAQELLVMSGQAHEIVVRTRKSGEAVALAERLSDAPDMTGTEVLPWQKIVPEFVVILKVSDYVGYIILALVFVVALAGITNTLMMSTFERFHELGMLLALGSRPVRIVSMIVVEAILLGILGVAVGTGLGYLFVGLTAGPGLDMGALGGDQIGDVAFKGLNLPFFVHPRLEVSDTIVGLVAVIATSLIASVWPAWIAARLEPTEAMRA